ncbi:CDP-glycerol glycerophosphotransferase family protein [uncultured Jatrophihabitans sp.]|uniref:CDP-glycerol glycerophosphotransferase family protein n=1 Tax=uncultured Jatrophihabitans sp. TaxID=1610747 RepID=UPI0035C9E37B
MKIVYHSFEGRYSDNPRALHERWIAERPGDEHIWLVADDHRAAFPAQVSTVEWGTPACVAALEAADLLIANTHTDLEWAKRPDARYLQTWHGTPLKRIHHDVLWAPPGRLARLDEDVAKWDVLVSPNEASTPRLRHAFGFGGEVLETGYPRNDVLQSAAAPAVRRRVRAELGLAEDTIAILYTPTWRDDAVFDDTRPVLGYGLDIAALTDQLDDRHCLLLRSHAMETGRHSVATGPRLRDVSYFGDIAELYLAADALVTDYSSTMFDFAVTGKPLLFYAYDYELFRDEIRGFYFDLLDEAPGPVLRDHDQLAAAVRNLQDVRNDYAGRYAAFARRYCALEDGRAGERVLERLWKG